MVNTFNNQRGNITIILGIVLALLIVGGAAFYLGTLKNQVKTNFLDTTPTPVPSSSPGSKQSIDPISQGEWKIDYVQKSQMDFVQDIHISNKISNEDRIIGQTYVISPGEKALFKDPDTIIFLSAKSEGEKLDIEKVSLYSIAQNKIIKSISLREIKTALPDLLIPRNASLTNLALSPSRNKLALSYGYSMELDSGSDIIVITLETLKITALTTKGRVHNWKDDTTLRYDVIGSTSDSVDDLKLITKEVVVN